MQNDPDQVWPPIDVRSLTPQQWETVKQRAIRRAHDERARLLRALVLRVFRRPPTAPRRGAARLMSAATPR